MVGRRVIGRIRGAESRLRECAVRVLKPLCKQAQLVGRINKQVCPIDINVLPILYPTANFAAECHKYGGIGSSSRQVIFIG